MSQCHSDWETQTAGDPPQGQRALSRRIAYVVTWRYYDRSGNGVLRAYLSRAQAEDDLALLKTDCSSDRVHEIQEMELYE